MSTHKCGYCEGLLQDATDYDHLCQKCQSWILNAYVSDMIHIVSPCKHCSRDWVEHFTSSEEDEYVIRSVDDEPDWVMDVID